ncbi:kynureninase [Candidatus Berkiella aquae]|uniref:Kynureninase n=1 Tax=Candidatus Berkiella aquae TaxID=295108 RepID=A0A0Q9YVG1_9GAMM|nr:kynureninase [Candidatus Berkiella aquae]MCS5710240.1 kynureninase [Candidatus Berkiella aquae]
MKNRTLFAIPDKQIYLCGHSLGPVCHAAKETLNEGLQSWSHELVGGWNKSAWIHLPQKLGKSIAPLIGAQPEEVIVADSTSINLLKCLLTALALNSQRKVILTEHDNFPTDHYIAQSITAIDPTIQVKTVANNELVAMLDETIAVLMLTQVNYRTSQKHDIASLTQKAHALGILVVWDLSHSVGAMSLACADDHVDFAVGCTYKYLNGGPGAPGFIYATKRHHERMVPMIKGWMGHKLPFAFAPDFEPAEGIKAFLTGTPAIMSLKALEGALTCFDAVDLSSLQEKSVKLSQQLIDKIQQALPMLHLVSPQAASVRGSHVAYAHPQAYAITQALISRGVIVDYREPGLIRMGISPLYIDELDIDRVVQTLIEIFESRLYQREVFQKRLLVT